VTLLHPPGDDPLFLHREMFLERPYVRRGFYKPSAGQTVIDIGANIGWFAVFLQSRAQEIRVHCFEPGAAAIECLRANVEANGLGKFISVYPVAVSDRIGTSRLARHARSYERRLVETVESVEAADAVETITLEHAVEMTGAGSIDLLKIDVEGAEIEIVLGSGIDVWKPVRRVALEYHEYLRPGCQNALIKALRERGFSRVQSERAADRNERGTIFACR
jgi:FkbM family methyltransferase